MSFEACLLDYGNTIVEFDSRQFKFVRENLTEMLSRLVGPVEPEAVVEGLDAICKAPFTGDPPDYREITPFGQMERLLDHIYGQDPERPAELVARCNEVLQEIFVKSISIDEATVEFLSGLSRRIRVGLVSNYPCGESLRRSLKETSIFNILDPIVVSGDLGFVKPHERPFLAALDALRVPPENVLFVGDRWDADMIGAGKLGMKTCHHVGFTSDLDLRDRYEIYRPDYRISRIEELEGILFPKGSGKSLESAGAASRAGS